MTKTICQPWSTLPTNGLKHGIRGRLSYRRPGIDPRWYRSIDYMTKGASVDHALFFPDLNVPTRPFTAGFANKFGSPVTDQLEQRLIEYFGIEFSTSVKLTEKDKPGQYDFALLSDDGVTLKVKQKGDFQVLISDEGDHMTKMSCADSPIEFKHNQELQPLKLQYYQGPRYHISLVLLMREHQANKDPLCGRSGNRLFFDSEKGSAEQPAYLELLDRGWQVLSPRHFVLNSEDQYNPCSTGSPVTITQFSLVEVFSDKLIVSWKTDIQATSQLKIKNLETQEIVVTLSDQILRTEHLLDVSGLKPNTRYQIEAISISDANGEGFSQPLIIKTFE